MAEVARFTATFPFQKDVLALPVLDLDAAAHWYATHFGMEERERLREPAPTVVMERDGVRLGFAQNGGDASQDGAGIAVIGIVAMRTELEAKGVAVGDWRVDERNGFKRREFFVVAPDALCFYFYEVATA